MVREGCGRVGNMQGRLLGGLSGAGNHCCVCLFAELGNEELEIGGRCSIVWRMRMVGP